MGAKGQWKEGQEEWNLFPNHFILQAQAMFWESTPRHLHLSHGPPIVCSLLSQQKHTNVFLQTTLTVV